MALGSDNFYPLEWMVYHGLEEGVVKEAYKDSKTGKIKDFYFIRGENIYISVKYLNEIIPISKNDNNEYRIDIYNFLKDICQEINRALGGVNNLEPIIDEDTNTLVIQDSTNIPHKDILARRLKSGYVKLPTKTFSPLQIYGYRSYQLTKKRKVPVTSFVRDVDLQTKISKDLAAIITIGATASDKDLSINHTAFSRFNEGKRDRFAPEMEYTSETKKPDSWAVKWKKYLTGGGEIPEHAALEALFGYSPNSLNLGGNVHYYTPSPTFDLQAQDKNTGMMNDYFKSEEARIYKKSEAGSPSIGFIPFELGLTMDGLSGLKIYNKLNVDTTFLPDQYPKSLEFVVKGVEQTIQNNDWTTKVTTIAVPKSSEDYTTESSGYDPEDSKEDIVKKAEKPSPGDAPKTPKKSSSEVDTSQIIKWRAPSGGKNTSEIDTTAGYRNRDKHIRMVIKELRNRGVTNSIAIVAWLSVCGKESGYYKLVESSYKNNSQLSVYNAFKSFRGRFGYFEGLMTPDGELLSEPPSSARTSVYTWKKDKGKSSSGNGWPYIKSEIKKIQQDEKLLWSWLYGFWAVKYGAHGGPGGWVDGENTGNDKVVYGDGATYRGRGFNQVTFKANYKDYGNKVYKDQNKFIAKVKGVDVGGDPTSLSIPEVAASVAAEWFISSMKNNKAPEDAKDYNNWTDINQALIYTARANTGWNGASPKHIESARKFYTQFNFARTFE